MAFSIPAAVSNRRGGGFPVIGSLESPLTSTPPSRSRCTMSSNSMPYPNVPEAAMIGFFSSMPAKLTLKSGLPIGVIGLLPEQFPRKAQWLARRADCQAPPKDDAAAAALNQHSSSSRSRCVDTEQRGESYGQIDRLGVRPVDSRLKSEAIKSERHMSIVRERRRVIGTLRDSDLERRGDPNDIPSAFGRI